jgi:hypothetical protein
MHHLDDSGLIRAPAYINADMPLHKKQSLARVRLGCAPTHTNTTHTVPYTQRTCQRCGHGVNNEHHMLFNCQCESLVSVRNGYSELFAGVTSVRELMTAAYNPEFMISLASCMQDMLNGMAG